MVKSSTEAITSLRFRLALSSSRVGSRTCFIDQQIRPQDRTQNHGPQRGTKTTKGESFCAFWVQRRLVTVLRSGVSRRREVGALDRGILSPLTGLDPYSRHNPAMNRCAIL